MILASQFSLIQDRVDRIRVPSGIGRIPTKIESGFAAFTADQFKNWVLYYSLLALRGILQNSDIECWKHFVLACRLLCSKQITKENLQLASILLLKFCQRCERQYGEEVISPSMHMMCHLHECVLEYGPLHEFWLFPFERFNGVLGQIPNNNKSIEVQIMKRFLKDQYMSSTSTPEEFRSDFIEFLDDSHEVVGSVATTFRESFTWPPVHSPDNWTFDMIQHAVVLPKHYIRAVFDSSEVSLLSHLYSRLYSVQPSEIEVPASFQKYSNCHLVSSILGGYRSRSSASCIVMAIWDSAYFRAPHEHTSTSVKEHRPARINFFIKHTISIRGKFATHLLVCLSWYKHHPLQNHYGKPLSVWECDLFEVPGIYSYVPVHFIISRTASLVDKINEYDPSVLFIVPFVDF